MTTTLTLAAKRQQAFERGFWLLAIGVLAIELWYVPDSSSGAVAASLAISIAGLVPTWLWIQDGGADIPIFPIYGLTFLMTYALPMLGGQAYLDSVSETTKISVGGILAFGLAAGTITWYWFRRGPLPKPGDSTLQLPINRMRNLLLAAAVLNMFFLFGTTGQWWWWVPSEVLGVFRAFITSLYVLSVFVHFHDIGAGKLRGPQAYAFIVVFTLAEMASSASLLLVGSMLQVLIGITAYSLGRGRVPVKILVAALLAFSLLHAGKSEMRDKHWFGTTDYEPQPTEYVGLYAEWIGYGLEAFTDDGTTQSREQLSLRERAGLAYLFLMVYEMSPDRTPYLFGASYEPIPRLLVPRFINPERMSTHEGTVILNVHHGLQTRETAMTATIAWDLIGEAQANFGLIGVVAAFMILGWFYARVERWSRGHEIFSFRVLASLVILSLCVQVGITLAVYVTALFQAMVALVTLAFVAMERRQIRDLLANVTAARLSRRKGSI
ncbi:hypothetical protein DSM104443_02806 [Usitatibacter rugosus]|uniref:Uncharacterized protein n=1 Tax=Usitatibacter rugosus TaxID=2732067 RepID=A0A6M4GYY5_9PROT|nr:hypothetical protein [Usitatibacter rugosus]QJR11724.1 hypothetical protein DSM104443_02806 [Usitatibacter rugosus]